MLEPISVVMPVYDGVTQLDFTGPHQFLSRTPDLHVRVASLAGRTIIADGLTFSNLEDLATITSCDVLLVPGGAGSIAAIENDLYLKEIARLGAIARYLTSVCSGVPQLLFNSGRLDTAPVEVLEAVNARQGPVRADRRIRLDARVAAHRTVQHA